MNNNCIPKDFTIYEPGFGFLIESSDTSYSNTSFNNYSHQSNINFYVKRLSDLFGADVNRTISNIISFPDQLDSSKIYNYYGNLKEELCDDNIAMMRSLIQSTT